MNHELKLEVCDSPNSASVVTAATRCARLGLERGLKALLLAPSSYFMKSPPTHHHDVQAWDAVEAFISEG